MATDLDLNASLAPPLQLRRFSVEQYHQLGELGVLTPEDNVELLEGWIVEKMNQRPIHGFIVRVLNNLFNQTIPDGWICQCQLPITAERSEPEPDITIVRGSHADFRSRHPSGNDCQLVIEVADTSLAKDRSKAKIYREAGVDEYWIINITDSCLERYVFAESALDATVFSGEDTISTICGGAEITLELKQIFS